MNILMITHFCGDFSETDNGRFLYLAKMLVKSGHNVEMVTTDFYHTRKEYRTFKPDTIDGIKMTYVHEPKYSKNVSIRRFYSHFCFGQNVKKYLKGIKANPDVVFASVPSLTAPRVAADFCKRNTIKLVIDVNDLWPEAFQMVFDIPIISNIIFAPFRWYVNSVYKSADEICGVSQSYVDRALSVNNKCKEGHAVFIGTELETFDKNAENNKILDKPSDELWLGYCGALGASYDLITVMDALRILKDEGKVVPKFIVMGDGARKTEFEAYAKEKQLDVLFTGYLPYDKMCGMLCACDIVVNPITGKSAASIINKHADYAACGKPVINTQDSPEYRKLVEDYHMGFNVENGNSKDFAEKLDVFVQNIAFVAEFGAKARKCAEEKFDRSYSYSELMSALEK